MLVLAPTWPPPVGEELGLLTMVSCYPLPTGEGWGGALFQCIHNSATSQTVAIGVYGFAHGIVVCLVVE